MGWFVKRGQALANTERAQVGVQIPDAAGSVCGFCLTGSSLSLLLPQMVGVGLGSMAVVIALAFLSFSAVWYVRPSFLRNEWNGGRRGLEP